MKILVDRNQIRNIFETAKHIGIYSLEKNTLDKTSDIIRICSDILIANPVESDGFKTNEEITEADRQWADNAAWKDSIDKGIDWCESRLQDHDGILIELMNVLANYAYSQNPCKADRLQRDMDEIKAKLTGGR